MNFYKHHIGDYAQATNHLSFVEDAAYSRLIRKYYAEEKPLPAEIKVVQRLVGARTKEEKQAVEDVLSEFFSLGDDGWRNKRCDAELAKANAQAETNRRIAEEREARKRERMENAQTTNRAQSSNESLNESLDGSSASREPSQTPDSRLQTPIKETTNTDAATSAAGVSDTTEKFEALAYLLTAGVDRQVAADWLKVRKAKRLAPTKTAFDDVAAEAAKAGLTMADVIEKACKNGWGSFRASWLDGTQNGSAPPSLHAQRDLTLAALTGRNHDRPNERDITGESERLS